MEARAKKDSTWAISNPGESAWLLLVCSLHGPAFRLFFFFFLSPTGRLVIISSACKRVKHGGLAIALF